MKERMTDRQTELQYHDVSTYLRAWYKTKKNRFPHRTQCLTSDIQKGALTEKKGTPTIFQKNLRGSPLGTHGLRGETGVSVPSTTRLAQLTEEGQSILQLLKAPNAGQKGESVAHTKQLLVQQQLMLHYNRKANFVVRRENENLV
jgi:hypothetical protein